jgi:hypothetical protein
LADDGGIEKVQLRVESPAVKISLYACCSTVIFVVYSYSENAIIPVLETVARKRLVDTVSD